jgi:2-keto-4-pentenoate hydratase/2-oxohepta-3-ene-1,7-dioic acid hydratase in catechol pathway
VLCTGTGIIVREEHALQEGDVVTISVPEIGELSNVAMLVK